MFCSLLPPPALIKMNSPQDLTHGSAFGSQLRIFCQVFRNQDSFRTTHKHILFELVNIKFVQMHIEISYQRIYKQMVVYRLEMNRAPDKSPQLYSQLAWGY